MLKKEQDFNFYKKALNIYLGLFFILQTLFMFGCISTDTLNKSPEELIRKASHQKVFFANYDELWKATHSVLKYTIASENQDFGIIETDYIKAIDGWLPPFRKKPEYPGSRYKLIFNFAKNQKVNNKIGVRITIEKKIEVFKDFISEVKIVESDGLEEQVIFYRIERELLIDQALKKIEAP